jgi:hypothetical protein
LILIGAAFVFSSLFRDERPHEPPPPPPFDMPPPPPTRRADPPPSDLVRRPEVPATCPNCGGPTQEVKWTGAHSAACTYCGSNLPLKN